MSVEFQYPTVGPTSIVEIRSPNIGDTANTNFKTWQRQMMDASVYAYKRTETNLVLNLNFQSIRGTKLDEFEAFLDLTMGLEIRYIDQLERQYIGHITNQPMEFLDDSRAGSECSHSFPVVFQGFLDVTPSASPALLLVWLDDDDALWLDDEPVEWLN